ncbi:sulfite exporter TauE/SafE family protein [Alteromonas aestuariivivens]|uniref:Probable membrane transporter protein n=1 Tax=Alteromonas aestuariivivens TaxID=1938339 RepID=A0A3D8MF60_9ALTE|nr:sulfite exporter TauE/SafE family protein [Alteromonas aestuariivivens]RDV29403.1 sulfite exporter TauE/SafE family protein [Alteromonas aestuariivivens]
MELELVWFVLTLCTAGAIAGITSGLFGNGGGFVVVPALSIVFPFFTPESDELVKVAIGTSLASIVVSSARSVIAHKARGAVDFEVLKSWAIWLVLGVVGGVLIANVTSSAGLTVVFAAGVLLYSVYFLFPNYVVRPGMYFSMPTGIGKAVLAFVLGGFSALLGIGGGTPTVITMVMCRRTMQQAVATAAGVGFLIGLPGAIGFLFMKHPETASLPVGTIGYINIPALIAISIGSIMTAPIGASMAHSFSELMLKRLFGIYLVIVSAAMFIKAF